MGFVLLLCTGVNFTYGVLDYTHKIKLKKILCGRCFGCNIKHKAAVQKGSRVLQTLTDGSLLLRASCEFLKFNLFKFESMKLSTYLSI